MCVCVCVFVRAWKLTVITEHLMLLSDRKKYVSGNPMVASRCKMEKLVAINEQKGVQEERKRQLLERTCKRTRKQIEDGPLQCVTKEILGVDIHQEEFSCGVSLQERTYERTVGTDVRAVPERYGR